MDGPEPTALDDALAQLGKLVAAGAPPERVMAAIGEMIAGWAAEAGMDAAAAQERVERLWDSMSKDAADLEEGISDAEGSEAPGVDGARRSLAAMQAAVAALAAAHERL